jgi:hypothetical protein
MLDQLRRQSRLLTALLDQVVGALAANEWERAALSMRVFADRLDRRIELSAAMTRRIHDRYQISAGRLEAQHAALSEHAQEALSALIEGDPEAHMLVGWLHTLFEAHLAEEQDVLWPLLAAESRA